MNNTKEVILFTKLRPLHRLPKITKTQEAYFIYIFIY